MIRPWLRVAQPDDWTGGLVRLLTWPVYFVVLLPVIIGKMPDAWWLFGSDIPIRLAIGLVTLYLLGWLRAIVFALLPKTVVQLGGRVWLRHHGGRVAVAIASINTIDVELRPGGEVFVIELAPGVDQVEGDVYELCPVGWRGAERVYAVLARKVRWAKQRMNRRERRAERRRAKGQ